MKLPSEVMPAATAALFDRLKGEPLLSSFTLIGGTGLSLHIGHRISEDLDFITVQEKLPRAALGRLIDNLRLENHLVVSKDDPAAYDDFLNAGMDVHDYSQNWIVDHDVKLTFFTADYHHRNILGKTGSTHGFEIGTFFHLCQLKALVAASRSKGRDWLDLFVLERDHQFGLRGWKEAYKKAELTDTHFETALSRICSGKVQPGDEGFLSLMPNPPLLEDIAEHFRLLRKKYEVETARELLKKNDTPADPV